MSKYQPGPVARWFFRAPSRLYDWRLGWLLGRRFCRLTHLGRKSGKTYRTVVEVVGHDRATEELLVVSGFGRSADWYRNLQAKGSALIECGRRKYDADWRELDLDQAANVMAAYERRNRLIMPVARRVLGAMVGWQYDGSEEARRRLVTELPILAFTPKP